MKKIFFICWALCLNFVTSKEIISGDATGLPEYPQSPEEMTKIAIAPPHNFNLDQYSSLKPEIQTKNLKDLVNSEGSSPGLIPEISESAQQDEENARDGSIEEEFLESPNKPNSNKPLELRNGDERQTEKEKSERKEKFFRRGKLEENYASGRADRSFRINENVTRFSKFDSNIRNGKQIGRTGATDKHSKEEGNFRSRSNLNEGRPNFRNGARPEMEDTRGGSIKRNRVVEDQRGGKPEDGSRMNGERSTRSSFNQRRGSRFETNRRPNGEIRRDEKSGDFENGPHGREFRNLRQERMETYNERDTYNRRQGRPGMEGSERLRSSPKIEANKKQLLRFDDTVSRERPTNERVVEGGTRRQQIQNTKNQDEGQRRRPKVGPTGRRPE